MPPARPSPAKSDPAMFRATVLTLFPEMFPGPLGVSLAGDALARGLWSINQNAGSDTPGASDASTRNSKVPRPR